MIDSWSSAGFDEATSMLGWAMVSSAPDQVTSPAALWTIFLSSMLLWASVAYAVSVPFAFLGVRWSTHWNLLPPPTNERPLPRGVRATVEGEIVGADQQVPVPGEPGERCVAWVCSAMSFRTGGDVRTWIGRSRPFDLKCDDGRTIRIALRTAHWHANFMGSGPSIESREASSIDEEIERAFDEAYEGHLREHHRSLFGSDWTYEFAEMKMGQRVTLSGFFEPTAGATDVEGYRSITQEEAYDVFTASELPPAKLPSPNSIAHRRGRSPSWLSENHVVLFRGSYSDTIGRSSPKLRYAIRRALLVSTFFAVSGACIAALVVAVRVTMMS